MYYCLKNIPDETPQGYQLVPLREGDFENIRRWRNGQMEILRQSHPITCEEQVEYFKEIIQPTFLETKPEQILFSFLFKGECIGYGGLTHIDWNYQRGEVSFLLNPERIERGYGEDFTQFLHLITHIAFKELKFHRLYTETFDFRPLHVKTLEDFGFKLEGRLKEHVFKLGKWQDSLIHGLVH